MSQYQDAVDYICYISRVIFNESLQFALLLLSFCIALVCGFFILGRYWASIIYSHRQAVEQVIRHIFLEGVLVLYFGLALMFASFFIGGCAMIVYIAASYKSSKAHNYSLEEINYEVHKEHFK